MKKTDLIEVRHPDVEKSARVPRSALKRMEGWFEVTESTEDTPALTSADVDQLQGKALDDALKANDLSTSGKVDQKKARLAEHLEQLEDSRDGDNDPDGDGADGNNEES